MAYRSSSSATGNVSQPAVTVPAGNLPGDIIIIVENDDGTTAPGLPSGFTSLFSKSAWGTDGQSTTIGWKRVTGSSDTGSYTWVNTVSTVWAAAAFCFSGRDAGNPPVISTSSESDPSNTSPVTASSNSITALAGDDLIWLLAPDNTNTITAVTPPTGYTTQQNAGDATLAAAAGATKDNAAAGATGAVSGSFTLSAGGSGWICDVIRIPAAITAAPPPVPQGGRYWRNRRRFRTQPPIPPPPVLGIRVVQTAEIKGANSGSFASPVGAGNAVFVFAGGSAGAGSVSTCAVTAVTLGGSESLTQQVAQDDGASASASCSEIWLLQAAAGGETSLAMTVSGGVAADDYMYAVEVAGFASPPVLDKSSSGPLKAGTTTWTSNATATTTAPAEFIFGGTAHGPNSATDTLTGPGSPWTNATGFVWGSGSYLAGYQVASSTAAFTYSGTSPDFDFYTCVVGTFMAGAPAVSAPAAPAAVSVVAPPAQAAVTAQAGVATVAAVAPAATPAAGAVPAAAAVSAVSLQPAVAETAVAGVAAVASAAPAATADVKTNLTAAQVSAVAPAAVSPALTANAAPAAVTSAAPQPTTAVTAFAGVATVAAVAPAATVSTASATNAPAAVATVSVVAPAATAAEGAVAGAAQVAAVAPAAGHSSTASTTAAIVATTAPAGLAAVGGVTTAAVVLALAPPARHASTANAGVAIVGAVAPAATVSTSSAVNAQAGVATVSAVAPAASGSVSVNAAPAAAGSAAAGALASAGALPPAATISALALPSQQIGITVSAGVAIVNAAAPPASAGTTRNAPAGVATVAAVAPAASAAFGLLVFAGVAQVTAGAPPLHAAIGVGAGPAAAGALAVQPAQVVHVAAKVAGSSTPGSSSSSASARRDVEQTATVGQAGASSRTAPGSSHASAGGPI